MITHHSEVNENRWTTDWVPISYKHFKKYQLEKSSEYWWMGECKPIAFARAYFRSNYHIELGDVWIDPSYRGKIYETEKYSVSFLKSVIAKIWHYYPKATKITLLVESTNIPALKLYQKLNFEVIAENVDNELNLKNALELIRIKHHT